MIIEGKKIIQDVTSLHASLYPLFAQMAEYSGSVSANLLSTRSSCM